MTKITATFRNGETVTRTTDADYRFATRRHGKVAFHTTRTAAERRGGEIVPVDGTGPEPVVETPEVPEGATCTVVVNGFGERCGEPAVVAVPGRTRTYFECEAHAR